MSKRTTESQLTKDDYERGDTESSSVMGSFKMASSEELARRPIKTIRRLNKSISTVSEDGVRLASPFAFMGSLSAPASVSNFPPDLPENNTIAPTSKGSSVSTRSSTAAAAASTPTPHPTTGITEPSKTAAQEESAQDRGARAFSPIATLSKGAFTFNVGSSSRAFSASPRHEPTSASTPVLGDVEGYERAKRASNQAFLKKVQKELHNNAGKDLSHLFNQYKDHRQRLSKMYLGTDEPKAIILSGSPSQGSNRSMDKVPSSPSAPPHARRAKLASGYSSGDTHLSSPLPRTGNSAFGLPIGHLADGTSLKKPFANTSAGAMAISPAAPSSATFLFSPSSIKGALDPPRNPGSGLSFSLSRGPAPSAISPKSTSPVLGFASLISAAGGTVSSTPLSTISSSTSNSSQPFTFNPSAKPFAYAPRTTPAAGSASIKATPFATAPVPLDVQLSSGRDLRLRGPPAQEVETEEQEKEDGEELEQQTIYEVKAKLFGFVKNEHKDLGVGQFFVKEVPETHKKRMVMRTASTGLLALNSWVIPGMGPKREKNTLTIFALEGGRPKRFLLRVKEEKSAEELFLLLQDGSTSTPASS